MSEPVDISPAKLKPVAEAVQEILARHVGDQCQCDGLGSASYGIARFIATREADVLGAAQEALRILDKGALGWGVAKDLLRAAISRAQQ